jgi:hypothetical protein
MQRISDDVSQTVRKLESKVARVIIDGAVAHESPTAQQALR